MIYTWRLTNTSLSQREATSSLLRHPNASFDLTPRRRQASAKRRRSRVVSETLNSAAPTQLVLFRGLFSQHLFQVTGRANKPVPPIPPNLSGEAEKRCGGNFYCVTQPTTAKIKRAQEVEVFQPVDNDQRKGKNNPARLLLPLSNAKRVSSTSW